MGKYIFDIENQRKIEKFMLYIYSIYSINILIMSQEGNWGFLIDFLILAGVSAGWVTHVSKYRSYLSRVRIVAIMMQVSMVIFATHVEYLPEALPVYMAFVVLLGLYGQPKFIWLTVISTVIIFGYHGFVSGSLPLGTMKEIGQFSSKMGNVLLLEYIVYTWTKQNSEGSAQLIGMIKELHESQNSKDDFVANVSHEIRTPINTVCGMSDIILQEELPFEIKEKVLDIQRAGRNLSSLVSDILDFSELQSGKIELEEEAYNISTTINDVINMTMARINQKKIELIVDCDAHVPCALLGDEKKIRRVIMKLVDNAIKFTNEGCVTIAVGYRKESYGINLMVTIKDTGIGMSEESLEKIFNSFNQVDSSRKRQEDGIGLGLAISQALVQKMGGATTIKSKLGKGTSVKIVVPQKVLDENPIAVVNDRNKLNVATFIDMEQFNMQDIRDDYANMISHMVEQLKVNCHICRNFSELQRRAQRENFSHVFTSMAEYRAQREFFDELSEKTNVVVVLDYADEKDMRNPKLIKIYKPFYILPIVSVVNGQSETAEESRITHNTGFYTKDVHVLAVDDNRMNLKVIEGVLGSYGIKVTTATSGHEALEKINTEDYDFVFMDHMMPEMDGVETLHAIRQKVGNYFLNVPVIALTANAVAGTREMMLGQGFTDFVEKPIDRSVLERVLKRTLPEGKIISAKEREQAVTAKEQSPATFGEQPGRNAAGMQLPMGADISMPAVEAAERTEKSGLDETEVSLRALGLDVQKGTLYCNGRDAYFKVLRGYCEEYAEFGIQAQKLFEIQDWKNYTIEVHGIKGAMRSIGAEEVSEKAKMLEFAGKEGRIEYILEYHDDMIKKYEELFENLCNNKWICPQGVEAFRARRESYEDIEKMPVLEEDEFSLVLENIENAMYALDKETVLDEIHHLQNYQYHGSSLREALRTVERKATKDDLFSAYDLALSVKKKLSDKEN